MCLRCWEGLGGRKRAVGKEAVEKEAVGKEAVERGR